jgi:DNA (cytosine-5)-methyltransferase 1
VRPKAIDLFAGPGGLSLGLIDAKFDVIGAIEFNKDAGLTYRKNIGNHTLQNDITKLGPMEFREYLEENDLLEIGGSISLVAGGPPCPGFSLIGRSKISDLIKKGKYGESKEYGHRFIDDPRNQLFREFIKYVDEFQPDYFLMENVSGMSSYILNDDPIVDVIQNSFNGYDVEWEILNAADYGVPQSRRRIIFLGTRSGLKKPVFPPPRLENSNQVDVADAILDLSQREPSSDGFVRLPSDPQSSDTRGCLYRKLMRQWPVGNGKKKTSITGRKTSHWTRKLNDRDEVLFPFIKSGSPSGKRGRIEILGSQPRQIYGDIFPSKWESDLAPAFEVNGLRARRTDRYRVENASGKKWLMYEPQGFKDKMRRIKWDKPAPTVVAHLAKDGYMFIHPWENRTITVREAARFQSFPDSFEFTGSMCSQFRQVGNAVPPLLAKAIAVEIQNCL